MAQGMPLPITSEPNHHIAHGMPIPVTSSSSSASQVVPWSALSTRPPSTIKAAPVLSLLRRCSHPREGHQIHALMVKSSLLRHPHHASRLAEFYALHPNCDLSLASPLLILPSTFLFNTLIRGHLLRRHPRIALLLLLRMLLLHVPPDSFTFTFSLKSASSLPPDLSLARQLHAQVLSRRLSSLPHIRNKLIHLYALAGAVRDARLLLFLDPSDVVAWNSLLEGHVARGDAEDARHLFDEMPLKDEASWNTIMALHVEQGDHKGALAVFRAMQHNGMLISRITLITALSAAAQLGALAQGKWLHAYIRTHHVDLDANLGSALVNMYSKCGCIDAAARAFEETPRKTIDTWNAMIAGFTANGLTRRALDLFGRLEASGSPRPNAITFSCVLNACSHGGFLDEGASLFTRMKGAHAIEPSIMHYGCMVDLYCRAGLFAEADEVMCGMPMEADPPMAKAILTGCLIHRNFELGEKAGWKSIALAPNDDAGYVLLSNLYALAGKWDLVNEVRELMRRRGIKKVPGCSAIESGGEVHEFVAGDRKHARKAEIYEMLAEMNEKLSQAGYEPDTKHVLLEIEEEELMENSLRHHSEKIAIAFGLISMPPGTTIRVVKNLRVCGDCHNAIKLLSRIYEREIIVRDANRFHHFRDGACSCNDYW